MFKIFLAIGFEELEKFLKIKQCRDAMENGIGKTVEFVGETVYKGGILPGVAQHRPDVIVIREGLNGKENLSDIIYQIKLNYPETRVIFLAGDKEVGDALLASLVSLGVYDLIVGSKLDCMDIIRRIISPNKLSDVAHLLPKISVDNRTNTKIFEAPSLPVNMEKQDFAVKPIKPLANKLAKEEEKDIEDEIDIPENDDYIITIEDTEDDINEEPILDNNKEDATKKIGLKTLPFGYKKREEVAKEEIVIEDIKETKDNNFDNKELIIEDEGLLKKILPSKRPSDIDRENSKSVLGSLLGGKKEVNRANQQVLTFMGGKSGVGNSQISFNVALDLAQNGYKVIYLDLNDRFSTIDYIFQLGYTDVGINTALNSFVDLNYNLINISITNMEKILPETDNENFLYKTYSKLPKTLDSMFFSQQYMERLNGNFNPEEIKDINPDFLKDLNMYLLMNGRYDFIILDVPSDIHNKLTEYALIYSTKIFFTITQDVSVIGHHLSDIQIMTKKGINFKDKLYYLLNKNESASMNLKSIYSLLSDSLKIEGFNIVSIPNVSKEIINSNYSGEPLLWNVKTKEFKNAFSNIRRLVLQ